MAHSNDASRETGTSPAGALAGPPKRRPVQRWAWRVAGGAALLAFAAVLFFLVQRERNTVTTTVEGRAPRTVALAGGSTVRLMPGATLSYVDPGAGAALDRQATLEAGRAFFDIAPAQQGFLLKTPTARVTVLDARLDARFGVTAEERLTRVVLASGRVALASNAATGQPVTLRPGQQSRVAKGALPSTPAPIESLPEALSWTGLFVFRHTPAQDIARQLAAHYDQAVEVAPPLRGAEVTGTFEHSRPLRETLRALAAALGARVEPAPGGYRLAPGEP